MSDKQPAIHASAAEQALIGALLATPGLWDSITGQIAPDDFYDPKHAIIFKAASDLTAAGHKPDWALLMGELQRTDLIRQAGGDDYLADLASMAGSPVNVPGYIEQIRNSATARKIYKAASATLAELKAPGDQPASAIALRSSQTMQKIAEHHSNAEFQTHQDAIDEWERRLQVKDQIRTGIKPLSEALAGGLHRGLVVVLGGIQGSGKTTLAMQLANLADDALVFAMDTSPMLCANIVGREPRGNIVYSDSPASVLQLANSAIAWNAGIDKERKRLIVVDYLQIISSGEKTNSTADDIQARMKTLRYLARITNAAVLVCSAVSRPGKMFGKTVPPTITNLKGSSAIEFDADIALILWQKDSDAEEDASEPLRRELSVVKNRIGKVKKQIPVWLIPERRFVESPDIRPATAAAKAPPPPVHDTRIEQAVRCADEEEFKRRVAERKAQGWTMLNQGGGGEDGDFFAVMLSPAQPPR